MPERRCVVSHPLFLARLDCPGWVSVRHLSSGARWNSAATGRCFMDIKSRFPALPGVCPGPAGARAACCGRSVCGPCGLLSLWSTERSGKPALSSSVSPHRRSVAWGNPESSGGELEEERVPRKTVEAHVHCHLCFDELPESLVEQQTLAASFCPRTDSFKGPLC